MTKLDCDATATDVLASGRFVSFIDSGDTFVWRQGVLDKNAEMVVNRMVEAAHPEATSHEKAEVFIHVRDRTLTDRKDSEAASWPFFPMENGVIDIRPGGKFFDFDAFAKAYPEVLPFNRLQITYDPAAKCPNYWRFLTKLLPSIDDQTLLWDHFASILDRRPTRRRALLLFSDKPGTGKTTQLNVETALVGAENCVSIPLHLLCGEDRFAASGLYGKMLTSWDDLADIPLKFLGQFKVITGGGPFSGQRKGRPMFDFVPHARLHYTTNKAPPVKDVTDEAWWERWDAIECKNVIKKPSRQEAAKLIEPRELSGIFNQLLKVVRTQITTGHFKRIPSSVETQDVWQSQAEPARAYLLSQVFTDPNEWCSHTELFRAWNVWRQKRQPVPSQISSTRFNELVASTWGVDRSTRRGTERTHAWVGISYKGRDRDQSELGGPIEPISTTPKRLFSNIEKGIGSQKSVLSVRVSEGLGALFGEEAQP